MQSGSLIHRLFHAERGNEPGDEASNQVGYIIATAQFYGCSKKNNCLRATLSDSIF